MKTLTFAAQNLNWFWNKQFFKTSLPKGKQKTSGK
jgi:hypothetical protein